MGHRSCFENTSFFSQLDGDDETKFKKCHARVRYVSVPPSDLIGAGPQPTRLTARGLCTADVKYHNPAPLPKGSNPLPYQWPFFFPPTLGMNRGICARPVSEGVMPPPHARAHGHLVTDSSREKGKKRMEPAGVAGNGRTGSGLSGRTPGAMSPFKWGIW